MTTEEHWALWRRDPRATPFQSPAWLEAWWTHLGGGERRDVAIRNEAGGLVAALPMFVWQDGNARRLCPVGAGHSDYCDALVDPAAEAETVERLWVAMTEVAADCDELLLPDLHPGSPLLAAPPPGWRAEDEPGEICPVVRLPGQGPLLAALSKSRRRKVVHDLHRAERLGGVVAALAAPEELEEALDALFALHADRWRREGEPGVLADPRVRAFLRAAAGALAAAGLLRFALVRHEGRILAALLGFTDGRRFHSYINGVDMSIPGQSFGTLAFARLIDAATDEHATEFHFLRGEEPYKYAWGAEPSRTVRRVVRRE